MTLSSIKYVSQNSGRLFEQVKDGKTIRKAEIEVFRTGVFEHIYYGKLNIDLNYLKTLLKNWKNKVHPTKVSFDKDHNHASGATAWLPFPDEDMKALFIRKKKMMSNGKERECYVLVAHVELSDLGIDLLDKKMYMYFSAEINPNYKSYEVHYELDATGQVKEEERKEYGPTLVGGALTNFPFIIGMEPISLSFSMDLSATSIAEGSDPMQALGTKESLMLFSHEFAKKKTDKESEMEDQEEEYSDDEDADDMPGEGEAEDSDEDDLDEDGKPKKPSKKKKKLSDPKPAKEEDKKQDKNEYAEIPSGSAPVQSETTSTTDTYSTETNTMLLSQLIADLKDKDIKAQITTLESNLFSLSDSDKAVAESLLAAKREVALKETALQTEMQVRIARDTEVASLKLSVTDLALKAEQNKQLAYNQQVEVFCNSLEKENHYPAVIAHVKSILTGVKADQRDQKFSIVADGAEKPLDLFSLVQGLLETLPPDARFQPETDGEQTFNATSGKTAPKTDEAKQDKFDLAFANYGEQLGFSTAEALRASGEWNDRLDDKGDIVISRTQVGSQIPQN